MTFDFVKTLSLVKGGILDHQATWNTYLEENRDWLYTATVLTGPLLIANVVLSVLLSRMTGGFAYMGYHDNLLANLPGLEGDTFLHPTALQAAANLRPTQPSKVIFTDDRAAIEWMTNALLFEFMLKGDADSLTR